jgi:hypothetical protein
VTQNEYTVPTEGAARATEHGDEVCESNDLPLLVQ